MTTNIQPLIIGNVIEDVVDIFEPKVTMRISYAAKQICNACTIKPSMAEDSPTVSISGSPDELFTLVMTDPDYPNPNDPIKREFVHWVATNIPGGTDPSQGDEVVQYMSPMPPLGIHRYVFVLFQQKQLLPEVEPLADRVCFSTRAFAANNDLGAPVAVVYFYAKREPKRRRNY